MVYIGPSLKKEEASKILAVDYLPPVKRGDLTRLPKDVDVVGIVDGILLTDAAVGHREILSVMNEGVKVFGGGSMGALRAAELSDLGMVGVGRIFEEYSSGRVEGDDEVVLAFDPFDQTPLSEPLINLRLNLHRAHEAGFIDRACMEILMRELKSVYYPRRSYELLFSIAREKMSDKGARPLIEFLRENAVDYKRDDAILLLKAVKTYIEKNRKIESR